MYDVLFVRNIVYKSTTNLRTLFKWRAVFLERIENRQMSAAVDFRQGR
jgi:hypothetical protein